MLDFIRGGGSIREGNHFPDKTESVNRLRRSRRAEGAADLLSQLKMECPAVKIAITVVTDERSRAEA